MNNEYDMQDKFLISAQLIRVCLLGPGRPQIILLGCSVVLFQRTMERISAHADGGPRSPSVHA